MISRSPKTFRCPLIFSVAGLIAIALIGYNGGEPILAIGLSILFIAQYFVNARLPESSSVTWLIRLALYILVVMAGRLADENVGEPGDPHAIVIAGFVFASEMVLQCWRVRPAGSPPGNSLIFFAGLSYMCGCYVSSTDIVPLTTPVFFVLLMLSWRRLNARTLNDLMSTWAKAIYVMTLVSAVTIGIAVFVSVSYFHTNLDQYALTLFKNSSALSDDGISDQPQLGSVYGQEGSTERVLVVHGDLPDPHLRAVSFMDYLNGSWGPPLHSIRLTPTGTLIGSRKQGDKSVTITKLMYASGYLYYPLDCTSIDLGEETGALWSIANSGPIQSTALPPTTYSVSVGKGQLDKIDAPLSAAVRAEDLVVPKEISPLVVKIAKSVTANVGTDDGKILAISTYLDKNHGYSLNYDPAPGDPISTFILSKKSADCEYFASAAVILLRCVGIPARYVIGYYAHEQDGPREIVVRQRDAHAWAEAYIDGTWVTVDATPGGGAEQLFSPVSKFQILFEKFEDAIQALQDRAALIGPVKIVEIAAIAVGIYFFVRVAFREWRSRSLLTKKRKKDAQLQLVAAERFSELLRRKRIVIPEGVTWFEYFDDESEQPFDPGDVREFINEYNSLRFGDGDEGRVLELLENLERSNDVKERV